MLSQFLIFIFLIFEEILPMGPNPKNLFATLKSAAGPWLGLMLSPPPPPAPMAPAPVPSPPAGESEVDAELARIRERLDIPPLDDSVAINPDLDWFEVVTNEHTAYYHRPTNHLQWDRPPGWVKIVTAKFGGGGSRKIELA